MLFPDLPPSQISRFSRSFDDEPAELRPALHNLAIIREALRDMAAGQAIRGIR
jgi:hypothetical protein